MHEQSIRMKLSNRLRALRSERKLTQEKVAQKAGISLPYLQMLESRTPKKNATILTLERLANAYDMPVWKLLKYEE